MNKQIKELLSQCKQESIDGPFATPYVDQEKFALLIVRECMQQVEEQYLPMMENQDDKGPNRDTYWDSYVQCGVDSNVAIKQHFGIEE